MTRTERIRQLINQHISSEYFLVEDESHRHHVPKDAETHFKLTIVSKTFFEMPRIARHRLINQILASEFKQGLHALSLHCYTPDEFKTNKPIASPACKDGFGQ